MTEQRDAETALIGKAMEDIAGVVGEVMVARASVGGDPVIDAFAGLIGAAYNVACLGGEDGKIAYVDLLRRHADAVERSL